MSLLRKFAIFSQLVIIPTILSCSIEKDTDIHPLANNLTVTYNCSQFDYSDSLYFKANTTNDLIVTTTNKLSGSFGALPTGLAINTSNGQINITRSEAGLRYKVFFTPQNSKDTCFRYITISGIDYASGVYNLDNNVLVLNPKYKGLSNFLPCSDDEEDEDDDDDDDDDNECEFDDDEDDDDGDGTADEPSAGQDVTSKGVDINKSSGSINLKNTLKNGALGANPVNGTFKDFRIFYRLADNSQKALNFIDVKIHYFKSANDIPQNLLDIIKKKNLEFGKISNHNQSNLRLQSVKKRPPDIIIVGRYN